jgi:hypothetical protein
MRRTWAIGTISVLVVSLLALGPTAMASKQHIWFGQVGKGHTVLFTTEKIDGVVNFEPIDINFDVKCKVSGDVVPNDWGFFGFQVPLNPDGTFDLNLGDPYYGPFDWSGKITGKSATGSILAGFPLYDGTGGYGTQSCDNDPGTTWNAKDLGSAPQGGRVHATVHVQVTKDRQGRVHISVSH